MKASLYRILTNIAYMALVTQRGLPKRKFDGRYWTRTGSLRPLQQRDDNDNQLYSRRFTCDTPDCPAVLLSRCNNQNEEFYITNLLHHGKNVIVTSNMHIELFT